MTRPLLTASLLALAACASAPVDPPPSLDGGMDAPPDPIRPMELDAPPSVDVTVVWDAPVAPPDITRPIPTAAARLTVAELAWNPTGAAVGTVAAVADSGATRALFTSAGALVFSGGAIAGRDTTVTMWRSAAAVPPVSAGAPDAARPPDWLLGVDAMGRLLRVRNDYTLESVGERFGAMAMQRVRAVGHAGNSWMGLWTDTHVLAVRGASAMRYMNGPFTAFAAGGRQLAGAAADRVDVLAPETGVQRRFALRGATAVALTATGRLAVAAGDVLWTERPDGALDAAWRAPAPIRAMVGGAARVWFVAGAELGSLTGDAVALTQGLGLPADARIQAGAGDTVWVLRGATAPKLYRADQVMLTPEQQWAESVGPVFARRCGVGMCHGPPPMGRQTNLSTFGAWVANCAEIRARTIAWMPGDPGSRMPLGGDALLGAERAAVDAWTRARCP